MPTKETLAAQLLQANAELKDAQQLLGEVNAELRWRAKDHATMSGELATANSALNYERTVVAAQKNEIDRFTDANVLAKITIDSLTAEVEKLRSQVQRAVAETEALRVTLGEIGEPTGLGAVVVDTGGDPWTLCYPARKQPWVGPAGNTCTFAEIDVSRVLSVGVRDLQSADVFDEVDELDL